MSLPITKGRYISLKEKITTRDGLECVHCREKKNLEDLTIEHMIPAHMLSTYFEISLKQSYNRKYLFNIKLACKVCNKRKGNKVDWTKDIYKELFLKFVEDFKGNDGDINMEDYEENGI